LRFFTTASWQSSPRNLLIRNSYIESDDIGLFNTQRLLLPHMSVALLLLLRLVSFPHLFLSLVTDAGPGDCHVSLPYLATCACCGLLNSRYHSANQTERARRANSGDTGSHSDSCQVTPFRHPEPVIKITMFAARGSPRRLDREQRPHVSPVLSQLLYLP